MPIDHGLALLILIGRVGDVWSTLFLTPNLALEANPVVRRFKRPALAAGFLLCLVPYFDVNLGVMVAVPFLLVTASNLSRAWMARALGEREMEALFVRAASRSSLTMALGLAWGVAAFFALASGILWWLAARDAVAWYFAAGLALYGLLFALHTSFAFVRLFRSVRLEDAA